MAVPAGPGGAATALRFPSTRPTRRGSLPPARNSSATAGRYGAYLTYGELTARVFDATGIETGMQPARLVQKILGPVAEDSHRRGEPPLTALCVRTTGEVGPGYSSVLDLYGEDVPDDLDRHAAEARLRCYEYFGAAAAAGRRSARAHRQGRRRRGWRGEAQSGGPPRCCPTWATWQAPPSGVCPNCARRAWSAAGTQAWRVQDGGLRTQDAGDHRGRCVTGLRPLPGPRTPARQPASTPAANASPAARGVAQLGEGGTGTSHMPAR